MNDNVNARKKKKSGFTDGLKRFKHQWALQSMVIPGLIFIFIFSYIPMYGVIIAFKDYNFYSGIMGSPWVGLKHFKTFFNEPNIGLLFKNTIGISMLKTLFGFPGPIIFALLLNELLSLRFKKFAQSVSYLPHFVSIVVVVGMVSKFCSANGGLFNDILMGLHIIKEPVNYLSDPKYFWPILVILHCWQGIGWGSIIYCAAISGVDQTLYEAATIDGAKKWKQLIYITLPGIMPTIVVMFILRIGSIMSISADKTILLYNPSVYETADIISSYIYRKGLIENNQSFSTAVGLFNSLINCILVLSANYLSKKYTENGLF